MTNEADKGFNIALTIETMAERWVWGALGNPLSNRGLSLYCWRLGRIFCILNEVSMFRYGVKGTIALISIVPGAVETEIMESTVSISLRDTIGIETTLCAKNWGKYWCRELHSRDISRRWYNWRHHWGDSNDGAYFNILIENKGRREEFLRSSSTLIG